MNIPTVALSAAYWLHMMATVVWIGGLAAVAFFLPAVGKHTPEDKKADLFYSIQKRIDPLAWFAVVLLLGSGMMQMSANPQYEGFLAISNVWAVVILVKHGLYFAMVGVSGYLTWGLLPEVRRGLLMRVKGREEDLAGLQRRFMLLVRVNLVMGVLVLAMTAIARSAS